MKEYLKRALAVLCTLAMLLSPLEISPGAEVFAETDANVKCWDRDTRMEKTVPAEVVTSDMTSWGGGSSPSSPRWYVVKGRIEIE